LLWVGENPNREGLLDTPERVAKAYRELFIGYSKSIEETLDTVFEEVSGYNEAIIVKNIPFYSHCEHHMIPIVGKAYIGYFPDIKIVGLSKIARVVDIFSRRLQTQEAMTAQIADALEVYLKPRGVAVLVEAEH
ncbi:GTP cyclohydrolase I, partial [Bartonella bovis]